MYNVVEGDTVSVCASIMGQIQDDVEVMATTQPLTASRRLHACVLNMYSSSLVGKTSVPPSFTDV